MFTQPVQGSSRFTSFNFFLLNLFHDEDWQEFQCPMVFPQCQYNWCVTGENKMVIITEILKHTFIHNFMFFVPFRMMNMQVH
jgi:hypothetical protein